MINLDFDDDETIFLKEIKILQNESPVRNAKWGDIDDFNGVSGNYASTKIMKRGGKLIDTFNNCKVYQITRGDNCFSDYFLNEDFSASAFRYTKKDDIIINESVFQYVISPHGFCRDIVFNYYLKKICVKFVSGNVHTLKGEGFWKKLLEEAFTKNLNVDVLENNKIKIPIIFPQSK